jgi:linoleoyl-CoA desaturase
MLIYKFIFYASFSIVLYILLFAHSSPLIFILNYITLGLTLVLFAFNFTHDFSHNAVFERKEWNNFGFIAIIPW